jgi:hypothetical protein
MATYQVRVLRPAAGARDVGDDRRVSVTLRHPSMPVPMTFHFLQLYEGTAEPPYEYEWRHVGLELGEEPNSEAAAVALPELTALAVRHLADRYTRWLQLAQAHAAVDFERAGELAGGVKRVKPKRLDSDWYRLIGDEYMRHVEDGEPAPISTIAKSHHVTPSAASRWVSKARKLGYIEGGDK